MAISQAVLYRLSPGIADRPFALAIHEHEGVICSAGVTIIEHSGFSVEDDGLRYELSSIDHGLVIRVEDPGQFIIRSQLENGIVMTCEYKCENMQVIQDFCQNEVFRELSLRLARSINPSSAEMPRSLTYVQGALAEIVSRIVEKEHGSSHFSSPGCETAGIGHELSIAYNTEGPDVGEVVAMVLAMQRGDTQNILDRWNYSIRNIASISQMDGALVFDARFKLVGVKGIINCPFPDERNILGVTPGEYTPQGACHEPFDIGNYGTRHRSAISFAHRFPGSFVIVVSQDKNISIITRKLEMCWYYRPLYLTPGFSPGRR